MQSICEPEELTMIHARKRPSYANVDKLHIRFLLKYWCVAVLLAREIWRVIRTLLHMHHRDLSLSLTPLCPLNQQT
jgi:hypothetical protein